MDLFKKHCFVLISFLLPLLWLSFAHAERGVSPDRIVLGSSETLTGHAGFIGQNFSSGMVSYFNDVNERGGIRGRKIDVQIMDDQYNPEITRKNTEKLIPKVCAFIGYGGTPTTLAVLGTVEKNQIPMLFPLTGAQQLRFPFNRYVFNLRNSYWAETAALVDYAHDVLKKTKIAVFYQNDAFGLTGCQGIESRLMKKYSGEVLCKVVYKRGEKNFLPQAQAIDDCKAEVVMMIGTYDACAGLITAAKKNGSNAVFMTISVGGSIKLKKLLKNYGNGIFASQVVPPPNEMRFPAVKQYQKLMKKYFSDRTLTFFGLEGFIDAKLLTKALERIEDRITSDSIIKALEGFKNEDLGIGASVTYSPKDHEGLSVIYITQIRNGKFITVKKMDITSLMTKNISF